jgi:5-methylcytosine-specific restriction enzyme subunit McrC
VLLEGTRNLLRRGLDRSYIEMEEDLTRPRGRVRISDTLNRALMSRVQVACTTDEFSRNVLANQIIKTTLKRLAKTEVIDRSLRDGMTAILSGLSEIGSIALVTRDFGRVQLRGNNAVYAFLLRVCALAHAALLPDQRTGRFRFRDVLADPQAMGLIFQNFVRNFFRLEQEQFAVKGDQIRWDVDSDVGLGHRLLPAMFTDTSLFDGTCTIIVECKWTSALEIGRGGRRTLNQNHLRQLHTYMMHHARTLSGEGSVEGLLLYPLIDESLEVELLVKGQRLRVCTINFTVDWPETRTQLLNLLEAMPLVGPANQTLQAIAANRALASLSEKS